MNRFHVATAGLLLAIVSGVGAGTVKIGNSDKGGDLEQLKEVKTESDGAPKNEAALQSSRVAAVVHLTGLNVSGIPGLGTLIPEVRTSEIFLADKDVSASAQDDFRPDHLSPDGFVYARTVAEPHAPTRFFPATLLLSKEQQVKLHIHEGLHRALPEAVRENEEIVTQLTLAISSPGANHDGIKGVAARLLPEVTPDLISFREDLYPSIVSYTFRQFQGWAGSPNAYNVRRSHILKSHMYPFGSDSNTFGLGLDFSLMEQRSNLTMGPLGFSFRWKAVTARKFDVDFFGSAQLNTLSFQELKNSPFGRDVYEIGLSLRRELRYFYVENSVNVRTGGEAAQSIGAVTYEYHYETIVEPALHFGFVRGSWHFGAYLNVMLAGNFWVEGGSFTKADTEIGRFRLVTVGPELRYRAKDFSVFLKGSALIDSTKDADLSNLGLLGLGVGKGWLELGAGFQY